MNSKKKTQTGGNRSGLNKLKLSRQRTSDTNSKNQIKHTTNPAFPQAPCNTCGNSTEAQRQRLMTAIQERGSISTIEAGKIHSVGRLYWPAKGNKYE